MLEVRDLMLVYAVANAGTVAKAATDLGVHQATVFRRLDALERDLGVRLFERARGGYALTRAGDRVRALAERMRADLYAVEHELRGQDRRPQGMVRVTTTDTLVMSLLTPMFAKFRAHHPGIELQVNASNQFLTLTEREADVAIRPTREVPENLVGRAISGVAMAVYAAKDYLRRAPERQDLSVHTWIGTDESLAQVVAARWLRVNYPRAAVAYRINTLLGMWQAARSGLGLAVLPCYLADGDPELLRVRPPLPELANKLWLLTHPDARKTARIATFLRFISGELSAQRAILEGRAAGPHAAAAIKR